MLVKSLIVSILVSVDVSALDFGSYTLKVNEEITLWDGIDDDGYR